MGVSDGPRGESFKSTFSRGFRGSLAAIRGLGSVTQPGLGLTSRQGIH
jgi:hypothetical protein